MPIPGYDPDDLERALQQQVGDDVDEYLDPEEQKRYEEGEPLVDLLDAETIGRLVDPDAA